MKKIIIPLVLIIVLAGVAIIEMTDFLSLRGAHRYVCFFKNAINGKMIYEERFLKLIPGVNDIRLFAEELLLGPISPDAERIFPGKCSLEFCFLRDDVLFLSFSDGILPLSPTSTQNLYENLALYKQNIQRNFRNIKQIHFFCRNQEIVLKE